MMSMSICHAVDDVAPIPAFIEVEHRRDDKNPRAEQRSLGYLAVDQMTQRCVGVLPVLPERGHIDPNRLYGPVKALVSRVNLKQVHVVHTAHCPGRYSHGQRDSCVTKSAPADALTAAQEASHDAV